MEATSAASAFPSRNTCSRCSGTPAPPEATTGIPTASEMRRVRVSS